MVVQPYYSLRPLQYHSREIREIKCAICLERIGDFREGFFTKGHIVAHLNRGVEHPQHLGCIENWPEKCPVCRIPTDLNPVLSLYKRVMIMLNKLPVEPLRGVSRGIMAISVGCLLGVIPRAIYHLALNTIPLPKFLLRIILPVTIVYAGKPLIRSIKLSMERGVMGNIGIAPQVAAFGSVVGAILNLDYQIGLYAGAAAVGSCTIGTARAERGERLFTTFTALAAMQCIEKLSLRFILQAS